MEILSLTDVTVRRGGRAILNKINWQADLGQRWVILGPNGAGKTTLVQLLAGRMFPTQGQVRIVGETLGKVDIAEIRPLVGVASAAIAEKMRKDDTCLGVVLSSAYGYLGRGRETYEEVDKQRAQFLLEKFGVGHLASRRYQTLSTGEQKRVQIARALMPNPEVLVLDEPTAGLDLRGREELLRDLTRLARDAQAPVMVVVTHHVEEIPAGFTDVLLLRDGKITAAGPLVDTLTEANLSTTFDLPLQIRAEGGRWSARFAH